MIIIFRYFENQRLTVVENEVDLAALQGLNVVPYFLFVVFENELLSLRLCVFSDGLQILYVCFGEMGQERKVLRAHLVD